MQAYNEMICLFKHGKKNSILCICIASLCFKVQIKNNRKNCNKRVEIVTDVICQQQWKTVKPMY